MINILNQYKNNKAIESLINKDKANIVCADGIIEAILYAASYKACPSKIVILVDTLLDATKLYENITSFIDEDNVLFYGTDESFYLESLSTNRDLLYRRIETLNALTKKDSYILIMHAASIIRPVTNVVDFKENSINIKVNDTLNPTNLISKLFRLGYSFTNKISEPLQFAYRGGVIDVYPLNYPNPIRIDFFDDVIDSIRYFDINTQRRIEDINNVSIIPATDLMYDEKQLHNFIEILKRNTIQLKLFFSINHLLNMFIKMENIKNQQKIEN